MEAPGGPASTVAELRRTRRAFVLAQHPDRGGDPVAFAAGLARFDLLLGQAGQSAADRPRVVVVRRPRGVTDWLRHLRAQAPAGRRRPSPGRRLH